MTATDEQFGNRTGTRTVLKIVKKLRTTLVYMTGTEENFQEYDIN